jgi:DNA-binding IclR family transcriptional regulator
MTPATNPVKSTRTTFEIVEALQTLDGAGVTEVADHLDLPKSTVHNYLTTLEEAEYVVKRDTEYSVGIRFLELGAHARNQMPLYEIAKEEIERLAEDTGELGNLLVEEHGRGSYLHRARGDQAVKVEEHVGTRVYLHSTALGKAILAHMPEERRESILDTHGLPASTEETTTDPDVLADELAQIREQGYAQDDEERITGLRCVAAPVLSNDGRVLGAVSVSAPTNRMRGDVFDEEMPAKVNEAVNVIELNVTYS